MPRLVGDGSGEDGGDFGFGEGEAGAGGGEGCGELRVVFAEVVGGDEEVVVAGGVEPVADGWPEVAVISALLRRSLLNVRGGETTGTSLKIGRMSVAVSMLRAEL